MGYAAVSFSFHVPSIMRNQYAIQSLLNLPALYGITVKNLPKRKNRYKTNSQHCKPPGLIEKVSEVRIERLIIPISGLHPMIFRQ
jgi:hypothetical protein